jgi:hypothetical protein
MSGKKFDAQVNYGWGLTLNMSGKAPVINKRIFDTLQDAKDFADDYNDSAIEGLVLSVVADDNEKNNGIYFVERIKKSADDKSASLIKIGYNEKSAVETYVDALEKATIDNIGKVIYVKNNFTYNEDSESEVVEYEAAPYIIVGEKSLIKLTTSIEFSSIEDEFTEYKNKINTAEQDIDSLESVVGNLENDFTEYKDKINNAEQDIDSLENAVSDLENDFTDVEQNIENIKDEINNLKDSTKLKWLDYNI